MLKTGKTILLLCLLTSGFAVQAASRVEELKAQISSRNEEIVKITAEINRYEKALDENLAEARNLKTELKQLDTIGNKLSNEIKLTENNLLKTEVVLEELILEIAELNEKIGDNQEGIRETIRQWHESELATLPEILLTQPTLADFWASEASLKRLQQSLWEQLADLKEFKAVREDKKISQEEEKVKFLSLSERLGDQKKINQGNRDSKNRLLDETKNQEKNFRKLLEENRARKEVLEQEVFEFESRLRIEIDPASLPPPGSQVFRWPVEKPFITQSFGRTVDAQRLYLSGTHNGIDLRASPGTPIFAAAAGVVKGIGDTDAVCRGASYGRWALLEHQNGLSTLYAHLSLIKASEGETVPAGGLLGYSGQTGYATGPHLHFTVFATLGVKIDTFPSRSCPGAIFRLPLAPANAYLDPVVYL